MQNDLFWTKPVYRRRFVSECDMPGIALHTDKVDIQVPTSGGDASVIKPASPSTPKLDYREIVTRQVNGTQRCPPFSHIGVPVGRDGSLLNYARTTIKKTRKIFGMNENSQIVR